MGDFKFGFIELFVVYFSVLVDRKVPKERHQRAGRPLDTCFTYMGLFDRGYTRRGIRKASPQKPAETLFSRPAKLNPKQMRGHSCGCRKFAPQGKVSYPSNALPAGREKGRVPRGRRSAVRAGFRVLATLRAIRLFRPSVGERVARIRWRVSQGRHRG